MNYKFYIKYLNYKYKLLAQIIGIEEKNQNYEFYYTIMAYKECIELFGKWY